MSLPICGNSSRKTCFDEKQYNSALADGTKKAIRMAYKCPCDNSGQENSFGRYLGSNYQLADQQLETIEKITKTKDNFSNHYNCPWNSFYNSIWPEVLHYIKLKDLPGTQNINDNTPNRIYDGVLYYDSVYSRVDGYIQEKQMEKREKEHKKSTVNQQTVVRGRT